MSDDSRWCAKCRKYVTPKKAVSVRRKTLAALIMGITLAVDYLLPDEGQWYTVSMLVLLGGMAACVWMVNKETAAECPTCGEPVYLGRSESRTDVSKS